VLLLLFRLSILLFPALGGRLASLSGLLLKTLISREVSLLFFQRFNVILNLIQSPVLLSNSAKYRLNVTHGLISSTVFYFETYTLPWETAPSLCL